MTEKQTQRILDSFHVGRILHVAFLGLDRALLETTQGIFGVVGVKTGESFEYEDPLMEKKVNGLFSSTYGRLIKTGEFTPFNKVEIPIVHRLDKYFYCLQF